MPNPKIGIVVLHWNGLDDTRECLQSLQRVQYPSFRIYVIDNHSPDQAGSILTNEFGNNIEMITNSENLGYAGGNNVGIRRALSDGCDAVLLLNNDTVVAPDFLDHLVRRLYSNPTTGMVGPKILQYQHRKRVWFAGGRIRWNTGIRLSHIGVNQPDNEMYRQPKPIDFMTGCCLLIKRETIDRVGLLPEDYFLYFEDADWSVAVTRSGYQIWYEPSAVIWHKEVSEGQTLSPMKTYYLTRNYLRFGMKYANWLQKIIFILAYMLYYGQLFIKNVFKGRREQNKMIIKGLQDYFTHVSGPLAPPRT
ncbi:MAG: glycosyltransferase family 2 protein [Patescibacteria group bacterium]